MSNYNLLEGEFKDLIENFLSSKVSATMKLKGDASYRSYYRILTESAEKSYILMQWDPKLTNKSEEASKNLSVNEFPFINIAKYLKSINMPVPEIFYADIEKGIILLEDLGDTTLEREFNQNKSFSLYRDAITLLVRLKYHTFKNMDKGCIAFLRKFDYDLYMWEFEHFIEYGIEERNGKKMNESDKNILRNYFSDISKKLEALSDTFTHRDYQSRNLMIKNGNYYIIDFQDALISSPAYDIVALLRDSYICFDEKIINEFIELYVSELNSNGLTTNLEDFRQLFNLQTIQRKLKDGGRFVFIDRVKNNPSFLPYIPNSFRYAALSMQKMPLFKELYNLLSKYVPEFRE